MCHREREGHVRVWAGARAGQRSWAIPAAPGRVCNGEDLMSFSCEEESPVPRGTEAVELDPGTPQLQEGGKGWRLKATWQAGVWEAGRSK